MTTTPRITKQHLGEAEQLTTIHIMKHDNIIFHCTEKAFSINHDGIMFCDVSFLTEKKTYFLFQYH